MQRILQTMMYVSFFRLAGQQTIKTIRLTGKQIQALYEEGYDAVGTGKNYPYVGKS